MYLLQDFAVSGIRFGTLYTENQDVANAVASLCYFHGVCGPVQHKVAQLLRDRGESERVVSHIVICLSLLSWELRGSVLYIPKGSLAKAAKMTTFHNPGAACQMWLTILQDCH